ncbi:hypothetical protein MUB18_01270 [Sphingobacterium sp. PCS056]|uniref:hypothetical protein n=1 Tax=Sphingobacterium TaxID=28453 RepID=UPI00200DE7F0|nr:hypothetical protein [Sphingobacterium sp. PCS056]UPZ36954.1 hypothetical protein MUB18_01270 [Sphingobacterium sp. PCS056]
MKKKQSPPTIQEYKIRCSEIEIIILYRMMLLRTAKNLSTEEVSFLMGKEDDFIEKIESFKIKSIYAHDLFVFTQVLDYNAGVVYPNSVDIDHQKFNYKMFKTICSDRVIYELKQLDENKEAFKTIFLLMDSRHDIDSFSNSTANEIEQLKNLMDKLFEKGYFTQERLAYEILYKCQDAIDSSIAPKNLKVVLQNYVDNKEKYHLEQRISSKKNFSGVAYLQV